MRRSTPRSFTVSWRRAAPHSPIASTTSPHGRSHTHIECVRGRRARFPLHWSVWCLSSREAREWTRGRYGYAFEPGSESAIRLLSSLLRDSVRVWYAPRAFTVSGVRFPRGAFVVRAAMNDSSVHAMVQRNAAEAAARVTPLTSAGVDDGIDLGSGSVLPLIAPRVALLGGAPVGGNSYGFAWYALDQRMGLPISAIEATYAAGNALENYNVLIVPSTAGAALDRALGDAGRQRIADWVRGGGVLITIDAATGWAAAERGVMRAKLRRDSTRADSTGGAPLAQRCSGSNRPRHR